MTIILKTFAFYILIVPNLFVSVGEFVNGSKADQIKSMSIFKAVAVNIIALVIISAFVFALAVYIS